MVLAIGGGSVIDAAKATAAGACVDFDPWEFFASGILIEKALPICTVLPMMEVAQLIIEKLSELLFQTLNLPNTFSQLGVQEKDYEIMAERLLPPAHSPGSGR